MSIQVNTILALDVGGQRVGVAIASGEVKFAHPLTTLDKPETVIDDIKELISQHDVGTIVIGLPRGLNGQETDQTATVRAFVEKLKTDMTIPFVFQDEALTSIKAEDELNKRGKVYSRGDIDALAATYILEDYIVENIGRNTI